MGRLNWAGSNSVVVSLNVSTVFNLYAFSICNSAYKADGRGLNHCKNNLTGGLGAGATYHHWCSILSKCINTGAAIAHIWAPMGKIDGANTGVAPRLGAVRGTSCREINISHTHL